MRTAALSLMTTAAMLISVFDHASAEIPWQTNLRTAHTRAQSEGKLLLLHFYSDNCAWCDKLEDGAFQTPAVESAIADSFVPVKIHANSSPKLAEMFKVTRFPSDVIVTTDGKTISHGVSPQETDRYVAMLASTLPHLPSPAATPGSPVVNTPASQVAEASTPATPTGQPAAASRDTAALPQGPQWTVPNGSHLAAKAQLASTASEGLTLQMPEQVTTDSPTIDAIKTSLTKSQASPAKPKSTAAVDLASQPELAMDGYCAVSVVKEEAWVEGSPEHGVIHLGKLYLFASKEKMETFLADPIPYTPVLNEIDVVRFFEERAIVPGKREWAMQDPFQKRMFFFADEAAMLHFENEYERYVDAAISVMNKAVKESNPGI